jgi:hypothetical protein
MAIVVDKWSEIQMIERKRNEEWYVCVCVTTSRITCFDSAVREQRVWNFENVVQFLNQVKIKNKNFNALEILCKHEWGASNCAN